jgi:pyrimidine operon attenuation protein/uracil phosphoribosyltransferase
MDADRISRSLARMAHEILERNRSLDTLALVGIRARACLCGAPGASSERALECGRADRRARHQLYRDDLMRHAVGPQPLIRRTEIRLHRRPRDSARRRCAVTGRTIRAALDALIDFGRPSAIQPWPR